VLVKLAGSCHGFAMFRKTLLTLLAGCLVCLPAAYAQESIDPDDGTTPNKPKAGESSGPTRFWQASLAGGSFMVALDKISSVSRAKYLLDGAVIVDEVTVDTVGQALARFYFITPVTDALPGTTASELSKRGRELVDKAAERAGNSELPSMVIKKYPDTTHAKSVEFRLNSEADLAALYSSVKSCWESGRGRQFNAK
jgi:hypothetical protein